MCDYLFGRPLTAFCGYGLFGAGLISLNAFSTVDAVFWALMEVGLGIGLVKVSLAASVGRVAPEMRKKGYEYHYICSTLGFSLGGVLGYPLFSQYTISSVIGVGLGCSVVSFCLFAAFLGNEMFGRSAVSQPVRPEPAQNSEGVSRFFFLIVLGLPFFICSNQLVTGMSIFLHQCVDRTVGDWTIPALWFGVTGSILMALLSPWLRRRWDSVDVPAIDLLKFSVGFGLSAVAFAGAALVAVSELPLQIVILFCFHVVCFTADFHIRPVLFAAATSLTPARYHTLSTALVFGCVGLGGKLAGTLASFVDTIGFPALFSICSLLAAFCGLFTFVRWRRSIQWAVDAEV